METILAASAAEWTVLRPPYLTGKPGTGRYRVATEANMPGGSVPEPIWPRQCSTSWLTRQPSGTSSGLAQRLGDEIKRAVNWDERLARTKPDGYGYVKRAGQLLASVV